MPAKHSTSKRFSKHQTVNHVLRRLQGLDDVADLVALWRRHLKSEPPRLRDPLILRQMIAWKVQARLHGGFDYLTQHKLEQAARAVTCGNPFPAAITDLQPGTVLIREWHGAEYRVLVLDEGFELAGERFATLTAVSRRITGESRGGPAFFGVSTRDLRRRRQRS